ncbi:hypothetical protein GpartN1_g6618.t1 [Galdieria partita]|uniref:Uncharacterized protein n=1 Tax=Galdieria partita TaxID=83374 RepID=A0A9C7UTK0_9RHOD|nr:hypothetical protein GpartN1_g901.t1 [Galdieria partita]GJQ14827.1 hypothetical protein GpartN1_g6618.t1 [Galdieria partita]
MDDFLFVSYAVMGSRRRVGSGNWAKHLSVPLQSPLTRCLRLKQYHFTTTCMNRKSFRSWQDIPPFRDAPEQILQRSFDTFLQELASIQQPTPKSLGIIGTRNCSLGHQQLIELISYASVLVGNHLYTSGGGGTNAAAIRGALRADKPDQLTVILPQSQMKQPEEILTLLKTVRNVHEMPHNDDLPLDVASRLCNSVIISKCQQIISFAFHDSHVVLEAVNETKALKKLVTLFYLD